MLLSDEINPDCPYCNGTGKEVPDCPTCEGRGWIEDEEFGGTMTCPDCANEECHLCLESLEQENE